MNVDRSSVGIQIEKESYLEVLLWQSEAETVGSNVVFYEINSHAKLSVVSLLEMKTH